MPTGIIVLVRILFTFAGVSGHFLPAVPVARCVQALGHEVVFSCQEAMLSHVAHAGFGPSGDGCACIR